MTDQTPRTEAGRRLLDALRPIKANASIRAIEAEAAAQARTEALDVLRDGIEAFRLTREYVGEDTLPAVEGWSWFDWCEKARAILAGETE